MNLLLKIRDVALKIGHIPNVLNVNFTIFMLPAYVLVYSPRLLRDKITVRALEARRLTAFITLMPQQTAL